MERLIAELTHQSLPTTPLLLRSEFPTTEAVVEGLQPFAAACVADLRCHELEGTSEAREDEAAATVFESMSKGDWVFLANVKPQQATLLRKIALAVFVAAPSSVHKNFRLWLSTLTRHTEFEPPPSWTQTALPLVLMHLCNSPQSLMGDLDTMRLVPRHRPDYTRYDDDAFATAMADTAEGLTQNDPSLKVLCFEEHAKLVGVTDGDVFFKMLPDALRLNHVLTDLDLTGCEIGDAGAAQMGGVLHSNRSLRRLRLTRNLIGDEGVRQLSSGLDRNPTLRRLDISHNPGIGDDALRALAGGISGSTQRLEELCLAGNNAFSRPERRWTRAALADLWKGVRNSRILNLDVRSCGLSGASIAALASECLAHDPPLQVLDLSGNRIGDHGAIFIARTLKHGKNKTLAEVWLDDCSIGLAAFVAWGAALKYCTCLNVLSLLHALPCLAAQRHTVTVDREEEGEPTPIPEAECDEVVVDEGGSDRLDGIQSMADGLRINVGLHTLRLGHNQLSDQALLLVCTALTVARKEDRGGLTSLDLSANYTLSDRGAQVLKAYLQGHDTAGKGCSLKSVQLSHSDLEVAERAVLSLDKCLCEEMVLVGTGLNCGVMMAMRDAITSAPRCMIRRLDLSSNSIHREGLTRIGEILQQHPLLEDVALRDNLRNVHEGAANLAHDASERPKGLSRFKDWGVSVVKPFCKILASLRSSSCALRRLDLRHNSMPDQCIEVLMTAVRDTDLLLELDLRENLATVAVLPLIDAAMLREGVRIHSDDPPPQAANAP